MNVACSSSGGEAGVSRRETFKLCEPSGKSSIPAQPSKISIKTDDILSLIWRSAVLCLIFVHDGPFLKYSIFCQERANGGFWITERVQ